MNCSVHTAQCIYNYSLCSRNRRFGRTWTSTTYNTWNVTLNDKRYSEQWGSPSSEAKPPSASQQIPRTLWHTKVHHRIHNSPPPVPILRPINSVRVLLQFSFNIHFNITLPSTPRSSQQSLSNRFPLLPNTLYINVFSHIRATSPAHLISLYCKQYKSRGSSLCTLIQSAVRSTFSDKSTAPSPDCILAHVTAGGTHFRLPYWTDENTFL